MSRPRYLSSPTRGEITSRCSLRSTPAGSTVWTAHRKGSYMSTLSSLWVTKTSRIYFITHLIHNHLGHFCVCLTLKKFIQLSFSLFKNMKAVQYWLYLKCWYFNRKDFIDYRNGIIIIEIMFIKYYGNQHYCVESVDTYCHRKDFNFFQISSVLFYWLIKLYIILSHLFEIYLKIPVYIHWTCSCIHG